ncbi:hypothetical protein [Nocardia sp. BMG51109]|uniref:hypothetical protein n=1 Tax=Nocardia sp. BMG51109 TaxID=1056816 RepID=UPI0004667913|nr:hypothetical protein [Nocardia sp. BMG51109]
MTDPVVQVDVVALRMLAAKLAIHAAQAKGLTPAESGQEAVAAVPGSAMAAAAAGLVDPITRAYGSIAATLQNLSETAGGSAADYEAVDKAFAVALARYERGAQ